MPKVSIIVPVYNVEKYLDRCMQSLLNQTLQDIEIILVDDGSPDICPRLCDEFTEKDSRIKVIHKKNAGLGMACNSGLEVATGEYVAFCDSDDWVDADMYETMYDCALKNNADVVYTGLKRVDNSGRILGFLPHRNYIETHKNEDIWDLMLDMIASQPNEKYDRTIQVSAKVALYCRNLLAKNNLKFVSEREYPSEDLIFNVSILLVAKSVIVLPHYFYSYYVNEESISTTAKPLHYKKIIGSAHLIYSLVKSNQMYESEDWATELNLRIGRFLLGEARSQCARIAKSDFNYRYKYKLISDLREDMISIQSVKEYPISKLSMKYALIQRLIVCRFYFVLIAFFSRFH